jgi:hypothetical protein
MAVTNAIAARHNPLPVLLVFANKLVGADILLVAWLAA